MKKQTEPAMTQIALFHTPLHHGVSRILHGIAAVLQAMICEIVALQRLARERAQLAELDQQALKDIGLTRTDIMAELAKPVWRR
jgi:uncharacterized protein YjiS (DUF1127 family)